jgi:beta-lactam-binding protein with PASTA domain
MTPEARGVCHHPSMRRTVMVAAGALVVGIAVGALAVALLRPSRAAPKVVVPDVQRLSTASAFRVLHERGVGRIAVMYRPANRSRRGLVLLQSPPPGTAVAHGARVTLLVAGR